MAIEKAMYVESGGQVERCCRKERLHHVHPDDSHCATNELSTLEFFLYLVLVLNLLSWPPSPQKVFKKPSCILARPGFSGQRERLMKHVSHTRKTASWLWARPRIAVR